MLTGSGLQYWNGDGKIAFLCLETRQLSIPGLQPAYQLPYDCVVKLGIYVAYLGANLPLINGLQHPCSYDAWC